MEGYENICPETNHECEYTMDEKIFFEGEDGLGPCIKDGIDCDEKILRWTKFLDEEKKLNRLLEISY